MDLDDMTTDDLKARYLRIQEVLRRRSTMETAEARVDEITREVLDAEGTVPGEGWRQPRGAFDAYPQGWTVTCHGKVWESLTPANVWEPGVSGWREVTDDDTAPAWVQPTGAPDAYLGGDRVTHNGHVWESTADANTWEPGTYGWTRIDPEGD